MDLWRITVSTTSEAADAVDTVLKDAGVMAIELEDVLDIQHKQAGPFGDWVDESILRIPPEGAWVHAYVPYDARGESGLQDWLIKVDAALLPVRQSGLQVGSLTLTSAFIPQDSYLNAWRQYYHAVEVSDRLAIVPSWEQDQWQGRTGQTPLVIDPGLAFGTGTHETTLLCLRALEDLVHKDSLVLDVGTGTGILAVAAAKLGAKRVLAVDLDPIAVEVAQENCLGNDVADTVEVMQSDLVSAVNGQAGFHVVTANLLLGIVVKLLPDVVPLLRPGGVLLASGIVRAQEDAAAATMRTQGFVDIERRYLNDWVVLIGRMKG